MADQQTEALAELKKIAKIRVDRERLQLAAIKDELSRLDAERKALKNQIHDLHDADEASLAALMNAQAYLDSLSRKAKQIEHERSEAHERTHAQKEKIKKALASKIRIDGMDQP